MVHARPADRPAAGARADAIVDVAPYALVTARVVPHQAKRWRGSDRRVEVGSTGNSPVALNVSARDDDEALLFRGLPQQVTVSAGGA